MSQGKTKIINIGKAVTMKWKMILPPTGGAAALIILLLFLARACHEAFYAGMVPVEAETFAMGCDECQQHERPSHNVTLDAFWIDQYEVTNKRYTDFLNAGMKEGWVNVVQVQGSSGSVWDQVEINGSRVTNLYPSTTWSQIRFDDSLFTSLEGKEEFPVMVSWHGANAYCEAFKKRLPTEAEWEYAAKGGHMHTSGSTGTGYFRYSGSNEADQVAWHVNNANYASHPAGQLDPNELNTYDMSGNLREWVSDWYDPGYYANSPPENPKGPESPVHIPETGTTAGKVMRGGSWKEITQPYYQDPKLKMW